MAGEARSGAKTTRNPFGSVVRSIAIVVVLVFGIEAEGYPPAPQTSIHKHVSLQRARPRDLPARVARARIARRRAAVRARGYRDGRTPRAGSARGAGGRRHAAHDVILLVQFPLLRHHGDG